MSRPGLYINGVEAPPAKRERIFDHLEGSGEDRFFSKVAHEMHASVWWRTVPTRNEPVAVTGEVAR